MENYDAKIIGAVLEGNYATVHELLLKGANSNAKNLTGYNVLQHAIWLGHTSIVRLLLESGANVDEENSFGNTALHTATWYGYRQKEAVEMTLLEIIELLLLNRAQIDKRNIFGLTPLHHLAYYGHIDTINLLLKNGADINGKVEFFQSNDIRYEDQSNKKQWDEFNATGIKNGMAPLHISVIQKHVDAVKCFIQNNANFQSKDSLGKTPSEYINDNSNLELIHLLNNKSLSSIA